MDMILNSNEKNLRTSRRCSRYAREVRMSKMLLHVLVIALMFGTVASADTPARDHGLSAHLLPKRVAAADATGRVKWGYQISLLGKAVAPLDRPVAQSAQALVDFMKKQPAQVQANGIWVVTTHPAAYAPEELADLEELKRLCKTAGLPLFTCRGSELPDGWKRVTSLAWGARNGDSA